MLLRHSNGGADCAQPSGPQPIFWRQPVEQESPPSGVLILGLLLQPLHIEAQGDTQHGNKPIHPLAAEEKPSTVATSPPGQGECRTPAEQSDDVRPPGSARVTRDPFGYPHDDKF
jgi:hypothetical protein